MGRKRLLLSIYAIPSIFVILSVGFLLIELKKNTQVIFQLKGTFVNLWLKLSQSILND